MLTFSVNNNNIRVTVPDQLVSGTVGMKCMFEFDNSWDGYVKTAVFVQSNVAKSCMIDDTHICTIPHEVLAKSGGNLIVGVYGINGGDITPTIYTDAGIVRRGADVNSDHSIPPTDTVYQQIMNELTITRNASENVSADKSAVAADREAVELTAQQVASDATSAENAANAAVGAATEAAKSEAVAKDAAAQAGRDAAQTAQDREAADASKVAAETAKTAAQAAQSAAETARTGTQTAETNAGTYATNAGNSATAAAGSATDAQSAQTAAESARDAAVMEKTAAESARDAAVMEKTAAESARDAAVMEKAAAEAARDTAVLAKTAAETAETNAGNSATAALAAQTAAEGFASDAEDSATAAAASAATLVVVNDLTTGGTTNALSAEQGKVLKGSVDSNSTSISELTADLSNSSLIGSEIYGAYWDMGATPTLTRLNLAKNAIVNLGTDAIYAVNEFDTSSLFANFEKVTDSFGNVFVRIPRIYIKKVDTTGHKAWYASRRPFTGAYLPKCFWDFTNNKELDYVDVGAYNASSADDTKLDSKTGTYPLISKTIVQMRTMAQANGAGYQQLDIHVVDLLQTLFIIEQGTIHSQSKVAGYTFGQYTATHLATATETAVNRIIVATATAALYEVGQTISVGTSQGGNQIFYGRTITAKTVIDASNTAIEFDGTAVNIATGNVLYNTGAKSGFGSNIAASVGSPVSNSSGKFPFVWHGIENLFGSIYQFVDGVNINERQAWVCPDAARYASNLFTVPYEQLSYVNSEADGCLKEMGYDPAHPYASFPVAVGGSLTTYYGDYYYKSAGQRIARWGGSWLNGANAGLFFWGLYYSSSSTSLTIGGRLVRKPI